MGDRRATDMISIICRQFSMIILLGVLVVSEVDAALDAFLMISRQVILLGRTDRKKFRRTGVSYTLFISLLLVYQETILILVIHQHFNHSNHQVKLNSFSTLVIMCAASSSMQVSNGISMNQSLPRHREPTSSHSTLKAYIGLPYQLIQHGRPTKWC